MNNQQNSHLHAAVVRKTSFAMWFVASAMACVFLLSAAPEQPAAKEQIMTNLRAFTKLYGYVRYFHPSDEAASIDWERFAVYGVEKVKSAKNNDELKTILETLFAPIAPTVQIFRSSEKPKPFQQAAPTEGQKLVAWQHSGVGVGGDGSWYRSIRTGRKNILPTQGGAGFGTVTQCMDITAYRTMEIKLQAAVRADVNDNEGQGQLWLSVDLEDNKSGGFFNNMKDRPITKKEWAEYEIVGAVDSNATRICFGCFLLREGKVWVDDFRLFVRRRGTTEWQPLAINNAGFETAANDKPDGWSTGSPGYVFTSVTDKPYKGERCVLITKGEKNPETFEGTLFDAKPQAGEAVTKDLSTGLKCLVPVALVGDDKTTFGNTPGTTKALERLRTELQSVNLKTITAMDENLRLADVVIAWNVFQHFYPYFDVVKADWDAELTTTLGDVLGNKNERDFIRSMRRLVAALKDGHGNFYPLPQFSEKRLLAGGMALQGSLMTGLDEAEGNVVVTVSKDTTVRRGDIVERVDGVAVGQKLTDDEQYISGTPQWKRYRALSVLLQGEVGSMANLVIKRGAETVTVALKREFLQQQLPSEFERPAIQKLPSGVWYVNLDKAPMAEISKNINEIAQAKGVVFDLRGYPNSNHNVICHLIDQPIQSARWNKPQAIYPDRERLVGYDTSGRWTLFPMKPRIAGKVVFLTNGRAISYAESVMGIIEHYKLGEIVGSTTAGANGNVNPTALPGGFSMSWTGMKVLKNDSSQHHLVGIKPTVPATRTVKGITEGKDELLEKALSLIPK